MLNKLTLRNVRRSAKDYLIYLVTMTIISSLMFALHSMMFSEDMKAIYNEMGVFIALVSMSSFFIMIIVIWLVHYMVNFMLEKRSREFGTYLLLGMKKRQVAKIFRRENIILGLLAVSLGLIPGFVFQKVFINIFYAIMDEEYRISADFNIWGILLTVGVLVVAYLLALLRIKHRFKKMHIRDLIYMDKRNEEIINENKTWKAILVFIAVAYIVFFHILVFNSHITIGNVWGYTAGLIAAVYMLYAGLSSFFAGYIKRQSNGMYKGANLFVFRQLSSKIKTMRFTMGTLTVLFTAALLGWTVVMMFGGYQTEIGTQMPFDVMVFSEQEDETFDEQITIIKENAALEDYYVYNIYENGTDAVNEYLYEQVDGTSRNDVVIDGKLGVSTYFGYDTYIGESDYNRIREILGYKTVSIESGCYILHGKERIAEELNRIKDKVEVKTGKQVLVCQAVNREPLEQDGMNGADYLIVVPDEALAELNPYYSLLAAQLDGKAPDDLFSKLSANHSYYNEEHFEDLYHMDRGIGSNQILSWSEDIMIADAFKKEISFVIVAICFIMAYLGIVFLCAALTILAVQQLSDAAKYRFRYKILKQLGMSNKEVQKVVLKQLAVYYLCPFVISIVLSMFIGMLASERFVYYTGVTAGDFQFYFLAVLVYAIVYAVYFIVSYVGFIRNLER